MTTKEFIRQKVFEQVATLKSDVIEDEVMSVLSDEGGAAGLEPIEDALEDLESDEVELPDDDIEDIISDIPGVKRHEDGDFIDTTKLESLRRKLRHIVETVMREDEFSYKIAQAAADGKKKVKIGDKEYPVKMSKEKANQILDELDETLEENKKSNHDPNYKAPEGSKRDKQLDQTKADLASGDPKRKARAYRRRERMERQERQKPGYKNKPRKDTKKESVRMTEADLRNVIREVLQEELSKKTKETLKKKAEKRGLTPGSVYAEFRNGLAAYASSGSRKGMSAHQWAHARVNSATPSKSWAVVKKSKAKKKKK